MFGFDYFVIIIAGQQQRFLDSENVVVLAHVLRSQPRCNSTASSFTSATRIHLRQSLTQSSMTLLIPNSAKLRTIQEYNSYHHGITELFWPLASITTTFTASCDLSSGIHTAYSHGICICICTPSYMTLPPRIAFSLAEAPTPPSIIPNGRRTLSLTRTPTSSPSP